MIPFRPYFTCPFCRRRFYGECVHECRWSSSGPKPVAMTTWVALTVPVLYTGDREGAEQTFQTWRGRIPWWMNWWQEIQ